MDYYQTSITPEYARRFAKGKWIQSCKLLPRKYDSGKTEEVIGVYEDNKGQHIVSVHYNWDESKWYANSLTPPFEYDIVYWMPYPDTPKNSGEVYYA